jgi:hypothetical protein
MDGEVAMLFCVGGSVLRQQLKNISSRRTFGANLKAVHGVNSESVSKIPYSTEQGIFAKEQGI